MQGQRDHLNREQGDVEVGVADLLQNRGGEAKRAAHLPEPPRWLVNWERRRPTLLIECIAEAVGVFFYVYAGLGASATFFVTSAVKEAGFGGLLNIGLCYAFGIVFAIIVAAPVSGGHLSPSFTIAFTIFKGFPLRKVPYYILSQLIGGLIAALCVYGVWKQQLVAITAEMKLAGQTAAIFSPQGPAGIFALFPGATQGNGYLFLNELIGNLFLSVLVFAVLDACNFFVALPSAPYTIGLGYFVIINGFAVNSVALNAARDVPGRMVCAMFFGKECYTGYKAYTAIAALTCFPASIIGAAFHTIFMSDSAKMIVNHPPSMAEEVSMLNESRGFPTISRAITRETVYRDMNGMGSTKS
ncbi:hypothetical protein C6P46_000285 [Rhodotorula mucilaginosa]|uniref:Aquaporin-like protein n=1 Tax=Rhodotorula mucilaginosa TaxID=5537 RepID=A0A9P6W822_RHOMI|nr:hypothetical protein C6P46_000285 [Rhodotorula mucilaginosa]